MPAEARFAVVASTDLFDLTPTFEDAVLRLVPSALFLVVALQRLVWLARQPRKVAKSHRTIVKLARDNLFPLTPCTFTRVHLVRDKDRHVLTVLVTVGTDWRLYGSNTRSIAVPGSGCKGETFLSVADVGRCPCLCRWVFAFVPVSRRAHTLSATIDHHQHLSTLYSAL